MNLRDVYFVIVNKFVMTIVKGEEAGTQYTAL